MRNPIITLTTDFGNSDPFVGIMKGVIVSIVPSARIVDLSHEIRPYEISEGAFVLAQAWKYFPKKAIHVAVVDPGVGTARRPILVEAEGHYFIGPDNGILAMVYSGVPHKVREITAEAYFLQPVSRTFHGRDIFAPVAAHLASGVSPSRFGKRIEDHLKFAFDKPQRTSKRAWTGTILKADRFGNLITNFHIDEFPQVRVRPFELSVGTRKIHRLALTFADSEEGDLFLIAGSTGYLEVAVNQASAVRLLGCGVGAPVELAIF